MVLQDTNWVLHWLLLDARCCSHEVIVTRVCFIFVAEETFSFKSSKAPNWTNDASPACPVLLPWDWPPNFGQWPFAETEAPSPATSWRRIGWVTCNVEKRSRQFDQHVGRIGKWRRRRSGGDARRLKKIRHHKSQDLAWWTEIGIGRSAANIILMKISSFDCWQSLAGCPGRRNDRKPNFRISAAHADKTLVQTATLAHRRERWS